MYSLRSSLTTLVPVVHGARDYSELARLGLKPDAIIDFSANSNPYGPHPTVLQGVQAGLTPALLGRYPDRECLALRTAIAVAETVPTESLWPGNGANDLIQWIALILVKPGSRHLVLSPTFGEYGRAIRLMGGEVLEYRPTRADLRFEAEAVAAAIQRLQPDAIWLCQPNNPTGQQWAAAELAYLQSKANIPQAWWIVDESYHYFTAQPTSLKMGINRHNLIIIRSLTKDMALAGLRLGYVLSSPALIELLRKAQPAWSVNTLAQIAGVATLQPDVLAWRNKALAQLRQDAGNLWTKLIEMGLTVLPTDTTYALVQVGQATPFRQRLLGQGILVRDCTSFGLPDYVRIAAQQPAENEQLVLAIQKVLAEEVTVK